MEADQWENHVNKLALIDEKYGRTWNVRIDCTMNNIVLFNGKEMIFQLPANGTLAFDFICYPRCPTPIEAMNATGISRLIKVIYFLKNIFFLNIVYDYMNYL